MTRTLGVFVASLGIVAILPSLVFAADPRAKCVAPPGYPDPIYTSNNMKITYYVPHGGNCTNTIQGCIATSCKGLPNKDGRSLNEPTCLDAVRLGEAKYVTLAGDWSLQGKYFNIGTVTYRSYLDKQMHTVKDVVGYVHDTGCAFNGTCKTGNFSSVPRPDKLDVCTTVCPDCTDAQASAFASGNNVSLIPSNTGAIDPATIFTPTYGDPRNPYSPVSASPFSALGAQSSQLASSQQFSGATSPMSMSPTQTPISSILNGTNNGSSGGTTFTSTHAAGTIFAQPQNAKAGSAILVSWTSVNMKSASCKVTVDSVDFANGNEGSKRFVIPNDASGSAIDLECTTGAGEPFRATYAITLQ